MIELFLSLYSWMPPVLYVACCGVTVIFFLITFCHIVSFILDLIPFLR